MPRINGETRLPVGGQMYGRADSKELRSELVNLRDVVLAKGHLEASLALSHVIGWMHEAIREIWPEEAGGE